MKTKFVTKTGVALCIVLCAVLLATFVLPMLAGAGIDKISGLSAQAETQTVKLSNEDLYRYSYNSDVTPSDRQYAFSDLTYSPDKAKDIDNKLTALQSASKSLTVLKFATKVGSIFLPSPMLKTFVEKLPALFENAKRLFINSYIFETGHSMQDNFAILSENLDGLYKSFHEELNNQTETLTQEMQKMANYILEQIDIRDFGDAINNFANGQFGENTGFYQWKEKLLSRYNALSENINENKADPQDVKKYYDYLYIEAIKLNSLYSAIMPNEHGVATDRSILDVMYLYYLYSNHDDFDNLFTGVQKCIDFAEDLYSTYLFAETCLSLCYQYMIDSDEIGGLNDQGKPNNKDDYVLDETINSVDRTIYFSDEIKPFVESKADSQRASLSAYISSFFVKMLNMDQYYNVELNGYGQRVLRNEIDDFATPAAKQVQDKDVYLYVNDTVSQGTKIYMPSLPAELSYMFSGNYSFEVSDDSKASVTDSGVVTVIAPSGNFDVTLKLDDKDVYTQSFKISSREFLGNGTPQSPFVISNEQQLRKIVTDTNMWSNCYVMSNDISLTQELPNSIGSPTKYFAGQFDGGGHTLFGLRGNPLFGYSEGIVQNLNVNGANITKNISSPNDANVASENWTAVGGIASCNSGTVSNCHITASNINYSFAIAPQKVQIELHAGGIVGSNKNNGIVSHCSATYTTLTAYVENVFNGSFTERVYGYAAGIAGSNYATVTDCLSANNSINLGIKTASLSWASPSNIFSPEIHTCAAYDYVGGAFGLAQGNVQRCISYKNTLSKKWSYDIWKKGAFSSSFKLDNSMNLKEEHAYNQPFAAYTNGSFQSCWCDQASDKSNRLATATDSDRLALTQNGWNWNGGSPTLDSADSDELIVVRAPIKNYYLVGDSFNPVGILLYYNGQPVWNDITYKGFVSDASKLNTSVTVVAEWNGHQAQFDVFIACPHKSTRASDDSDERDGFSGILHTIFCNDCHQTLSEVWQPTGSLHHWNNGVVTQTPTCTTKGQKTFTCTDDDCNETYTVAIDPLGHDYQRDTDTPSVNATCTTDGYIAYKCEVCGDKYKVTVPKLGHKYVLQSHSEANCTDDGETVYRCVNGCQTSYTEKAPALGHDDEVYGEPQNATCTESGSITYKCNRCQTVHTETVAALGHEMILYEEAEPTYTESGNLTFYVCVRCRKYFKDPDGAKEYSEEECIIPPLGLSTKFEDLMFDIDTTDFNSIKEALDAYNDIPASDKDKVAESYQILRQAIEAYNKQADAVNTSQKNAASSLSIVFGSVVGVTSLAALAFVCKRYF